MKTASAAFIMMFMLQSTSAMSMFKDCGKYLQKPTATPTLPVPEPDAALEELSATLPKVFEPAWLQVQPWYQLLEHFALPSLRLKSPLLVTTLVGGGNTAKSTLLNTIPALLSGRASLRLNNPLSEVGYRPGLTRRMLVAAAAERTPLATSDLLERFGHLETWQSLADSSKLGPGVLADVAEIPENLAFVDSPDFDTGELTSLSPDNLEAALKVVGPSDVLILMFNPQNVRNLAHARVLAKLFKEYGPKRTILVYWADGSMPKTEVQSLLNEAATAIYDSARGAMDGVLGSYMMPYSGEVAAGKAHPELVPLGNSPDFAALAQEMNSKSVDVKRYSFDSATRTITEDVGREMRKRRKAQRAAQVYRAGITALIDDVSRESAEEFPYAPLRDEIRRRYGHITSSLSQTLQSITSWAAVPEAKLTTLFQQISRRTGQFKDKLEATHRLHDRVAVAHLFVQLQRGELTFDEARPTVQALVKLNEAYLSEFPEERPLTPQSADPKAKIKIKLPPLEALSEPVQLEMAALLKSDPGRLTQELSSQLNKAQFDRTLSESSRQEIYTALSQIHRNRNAKYRTPVAALNILTLGAPAATAFMLEAHGVNSTLFYLAAMNLSARPFFMMNEALRDRFLRTRLNEWFQTIQYRTTARFFKQYALKGLIGTLDQEKSATQQAEPALAKIESALKGLNQNAETLKDLGK